MSFLGVLLGWLSVSEATVVDRVAAVVNKEVIALSEVYELGGEFIDDTSGSEAERRQAEIEVLDALIQRKLVAQEIEQLGLGVTRDELERTIDDVARQNGLTREQLRSEVELSGLAWSMYRDELEENLRQMKFNQVVLLPRVTVTDDEVRDLYNRRIRDNVGPATRDFEGILLAYPADADAGAKAELAMRATAIEAAYRAGTPWADLVAENADSVLFSQGGKLGTFSEKEIVPELKDAGFATALGDVSAPIALDSGIILLYVAGENAGEKPDLELVRADLEYELQGVKVEEELALWYAQARRQAAVEIKLEP
ncbi:MAG: hypothetical protein GY913_33195 [Proteobacteria bacterium]|nr:hypothetical protein [Pseudomonadota bacterium]MCP4921782.1 hypothetical protein [Pseudomonadota bacterium]